MNDPSRRYTICEVAKTTVLGLLCSAFCGAETIVIDRFVTGDPGGDQGTQTVATLTLVQNGANVDLTLSNLVEPPFSADAFISHFAFGALPTTITAADFSNFSGATPFPTVSVNPGGSFDGGYDFAFHLAFPIANTPLGTGEDRFRNGEVVSWTINGADVSSFTGPTALVPGSGTNPAALAGVRTIFEPDGASTVYIADQGPGIIPEPSGVVVWGLLASMATGIAALKRPRCRKRL